MIQSSSLPSNSPAVAGGHVEDVLAVDAAGRRICVYKMVSANGYYLLLIEPGKAKQSVEWRYYHSKRSWRRAWNRVCRTLNKAKEDC